MFSAVLYVCELIAFKCSNILSNIYAMKREIIIFKKKLKAWRQINKLPSARAAYILVALKEVISLSLATANKQENDKNIENKTTK